MVQPVILCGGAGSRLWPMSRRLFPKQFLDFGTGATLFANSLARGEAVSGQASATVICNHDHRFLVAEQMLAGGASGQILLEPVARNTAPAIAAAAFLHRDEDPVLLVMPADHVLDAAIFADVAAKAEPLAIEGHLVTFGIAPEYAETGYGYIERGAPLGDGFAVAAFHEKPDAALAAQYVAGGAHFWNSGIFLFRASTYLNALHTHAPAIYDACEKAVTESYRDLDFIRLDETAFSDCPAESIDFAIMEKADNVAMIPLAGSGWSDLGSWDAVSRIGDADQDGNVVDGDVLLQDVHNSYIRAESRLVAAGGLDNLVVVETSDAVLIVDKNRTQDVKKLFEQLDARDRSETDLHSKVYRPWGNYETIDLSDRFQVKRIQVKPGQVLSLQMHHHRSEHWIVVKGTAKVRVGEKEFLLSEDQSTYIPTGELHRLENPGKIPLDIIEVQTGTYLGEDDIVRFEDLYGRNKE